MDVYHEAQLLPSGMTIHKRFRVQIFQDTKFYIEMTPYMLPSEPCKILGKSVAGHLLKKANVLILDEVTMMHKVDLERIEHSLHLLMENEKPFVGKLVILSGDFSN